VGKPGGGLERWISHGMELREDAAAREKVRVRPVFAPSKIWVSFILAQAQL
jgi:hypothetical protein